MPNVKKRGRAIYKHKWRAYWIKAESQTRGLMSWNQSILNLHLAILLCNSHILAILFLASWVVPGGKLFLFCKTYCRSNPVWICFWSSVGFVTGILLPSCNGMRVSFLTVESSRTKWHNCLWGALETIGCDWYPWTEVCISLSKKKFCELMFFWDIVVVVEECPCGPFCRPFTQHNCMGILELPIDDTTVALPSFVLLQTAAEALPSFLLFRDFLPGSQVHADYVWKISVQCKQVSVLRNYMGLNGLQFSSVLPSMKIKFKSIINMAQSFRLENLTSTKFYSVLLWHILCIQMPLYDKMA